MSFAVAIAAAAFNMIVASTIAVFASSIAASFA
jgi:hypothetical protein